MKEITIRVTDSDYDMLFTCELRALCSRHGIGMTVTPILTDRDKIVAQQKKSRAKYFADKGFWTKVRRNQRLNKSDA